MERLLGLLAVASLAAGCGSRAPVATSASEPLGCAADPGAIVELLRQGLPTYDYEPAKNLESLIGQVDLVLTGTLLGAERVGATGAADSSTRIDVADAVVLAASDATGPAFGSVAAFSTESVWADRSNPDPLGDWVGFDASRTRFVAFVHRDGRGGFAVDVQGLHVGCADGPLHSVVGPLPAAVVGSSAGDLAVAVQAIVDPVEVRDESGVESIPYRLIAEGIPEGLPSSVRWVENPNLASPGVGDFEYDDPPTEVFFEFVLSESGTCPIGRLDRLEFDLVERRIYPVHDGASAASVCAADAHPHLIFVAVSRRDLPKGPFEISVGSQEAAASVAFADGQLTEPQTLEHPRLGDPAELEVGDTGVLVGYTTHCDLSYLWWELNGESWVAEHSARSAIPPDWRAVERDETVDLVVSHNESGRLEAFARGAETVVSFVVATGPQMYCA